MALLIGQSLTEKFINWIQCIGTEAGQDIAPACGG